MDTQTGEIRGFTAGEAVRVFMDSRWVPLDRLPDPKCKRCHGLGNVGREVVTDKYVVCRCTTIEGE